MLINIDHCLKFIHIGSNYIGDEGITSIAKTLGNNRIRKKLHVSDGNITITGAMELAEGLSNNHSIKKVVVDYNNITMDGAIAILKAAIANKVCHEVEFNNEYKSDDKVKEMVAILEERKSRKVGIILLYIITTITLTEE